MAPEQAQKTSWWAILAIVFAFLFPLLGIIFGIIALIKINKDPRLGGKGLAIAAIIIAIVLIILPSFLYVIIGYYGVLNPSTLLPDRCAFAPGIVCSDFSVSAGGTARIVIENNLGYDLKNAKLTVESLCEPNDVELKGGSQVMFTCKVTSNEKWYSHDMTLEYIISKSGLLKKTTGEILTKIS